MQLAMMWQSCSVLGSSSALIVEKPALMVWAPLSRMRVSEAIWFDGWAFLFVAFLRAILKVVFRVGFWGRRRKFQGCDWSSHETWSKPRRRHFRCFIFGFTF